jgi:Pyruvate/2-oxoacid:ferredoxin oxidoreductase delta subunit
MEYFVQSGNTIEILIDTETYAGNTIEILIDTETCVSCKCSILFCSFNRIKSYENTEDSNKIKNWTA